MNQFGEIVSSGLSNGHVADIKMVEQWAEGLQAKLYADRGYISQELKSRLKEQGIDLITYRRKKMIESVSNLSNIVVWIVLYITSFSNILPDQTMGILIRLSLPCTVRIGKVEFYS